MFTNALSTNYKLFQSAGESRIFYPVYVVDLLRGRVPQQEVNRRRKRQTFLGDYDTTEINSDIFNFLRGDAISLTFNDLVYGPSGNTYSILFREIAVYTT